MGHKMDVIYCIEKVFKKVRMLRREESTVLPIGFFRKFLPKFWVVMNQKFSSFIDR